MITAVSDPTPHAGSRITAGALRQPDHPASPNGSLLLAPGSERQVTEIIDQFVLAKLALENGKVRVIRRVHDKKKTGHSFTSEGFHLSEESLQR